MGDVIEFFVTDVFKAFAGSGEFFVNLDSFLGHDFMGLLRTTHEDKVGAGGKAFVAVGIEAETNHQSFAAGSLLFFGVSHMPQVRTEARLRQQGMAELWIGEKGSPRIG